MNQYRCHNAYAVKDLLKKLGGKYEPASKSWVLTEEQYAALKVKFDNALGGSPVDVWFSGEGNVSAEPVGSTAATVPVMARRVPGRLDESAEDADGYMWSHGEDN